MYKRPRIIPCLLIDNQSMVKTVRFMNPRYLGDVVNAVKIFNNKGVDELVILDISATKQGRDPNFELLKDIASEAFMPLSYGGGITNIDQVQRLFSIGFEKVIINTALVQDEAFIKEAVSIAGSQSVVASIDYKTDVFGRTACYIKDGTKKVAISPDEFAVHAKNLGVGEILLNSINRDGMMEGYDIKTIRKVADSVTIPVIACGGAGQIEDFRMVFDQGHAHAAAAGSYFVYYGKNRAILISAPTEDELIQAGIYSDE